MFSNQIWQRQPQDNFAKFCPTLNEPWIGAVTGTPTVSTLLCSWYSGTDPSMPSCCEREHYIAIAQPSFSPTPGYDCLEITPLEAVCCNVAAECFPVAAHPGEYGDPMGWTPPLKNFALGPAAPKAGPEIWSTTIKSYRQYIRKKHICLKSASSSRPFCCNSFRLFLLTITWGAML